jgi:hypothetical protein
MTHLEYDEAQRNELPSLIYIIDEERQPVLPTHVEMGEGAAKLRVFKDRLRRSHVVSFFTTEEDLGSRILADLPPVLEKIGTRIDGRIKLMSSRTSSHFVSPFESISTAFHAREPANSIEREPDAHPATSDKAFDIDFQSREMVADDVNDESIIGLLIVEDHSDQRDLMSIVFQREGYRETCSRRFYRYGCLGSNDAQNGWL